jgi:hypothetical protein
MLHLWDGGVIAAADAELTTAPATDGGEASEMILDRPRICSMVFHFDIDAANSCRQ